MVIDVRKCNAERKYTGELDFGFRGDESIIDIPLVCFSSPVRSHLFYELLADVSVVVTAVVLLPLVAAV